MAEKPKRSNPYCKPRPDFVPAGGARSASLMSAPPPFISGAASTKKYRGKIAAGINFEKKGQDFFETLFPERYVRSPWLSYIDNKGVTRYCQPDGFVLKEAEKIILIVEFKLSHTSDAWWQVRKLYEPVIRRLFGNEWKYQALEVCRWLKPETPFPEKWKYVANPKTWHGEEFGVMVYNPRRYR